MEEEHVNKTAGKNNFDSLSKEELISKCKNLITISKKAKIAKDEAVAEVEKLKREKAVAIRSLEDERNKAEKNAETLQEMVDHLTDGKMASVTKIESLQRQLNLQLDEVENMKNVEAMLLEERHSNLMEMEKLKTAVIKQQKVVEMMKQEREKQNHFLDQTWAEEKRILTDKVEYLEDQANQISLFKNKCKTLIEEKEAMQKNLEELQLQLNGFKESEVLITSIREEKKAMEIVMDVLKCQNQSLEEKLKISENKIDKLNNKLQEVGKRDGDFNELNEKLSDALRSLQTCKEDLDKANELKVIADKKNQSYEQNLDNEKQNYIDIEGKLKAKDEDLRNKEEELHNKDQELKDKEQDLRNKEEKLHNKDQELKDKEQELQDKDKELKDRDQELKAKKEEFNKITIKLQEVESKIYANEADMKLKESEIEALKTQFNQIAEEKNDLKCLYNNLCEENQSNLSFVNQFKEGNEILQMEVKNLQSQLEENSVLEEKNLNENNFVELRTEFDEITSNYKVLEEETLKLISLVNHLFCLPDSDTQTNEIVNKIRKTYSNLESVVQEFKNSDFEVLFQKCFSDIQLFSEDIITLENNKFEIERSNLLSTPISNLVGNLKEVQIILSRLFSFQLVPDLISNIDTVQDQVDNLGKLIKDIFNSKLKYETTVAKLDELSQHFEELKEENVKRQLEMEERNVLLENLKMELNKKNEILAETERIKLLHEEKLGEMYVKIELMENKSKEKENELSSLKDSFHKLQSNFEDVSGKEENEVKTLNDTVAEKSNQLSLLEQKLSKTEINLKLKEEQMQLLKQENNSLAENLEMNKESHENEVQKFENEISLLNGQLKMNIDSISSIKEELEDSKRNCDTLSQKLLDTSSNLDESQIICQNKISEMELQLNHYQTKVKEIEEENSSLISTILSLKENWQELTILNETLNTEIQELKVVLKEANNQNESLKEYSTTLELQLKELTEANNQNESLKEYSTTLESQLRELTEANKLTAEVVNKYSIDVDVISNENVLLKEKEMHLMQSNETLCLEKEKLQKELEEFKEQVEITREKEKSLEMQLVETLSSNESLIEKTQKINSEQEMQLQEALRTKELLIKEMQEKHNEQQVQLQATLRTKESLIKDIKTLNGEKERQLQEALSIKESFIEEIKKISEQKMHLQDALRNKESLVEEIQKNNTEQEIEKKSFKDLVNTLEIKLEESNTKSEFTSKELEELKEKKALLQERVHYLDAQLQESTQSTISAIQAAELLKTELENIAAENLTYKDLLASKDTALNELIKCNEEMAEKTKELQTGLQEFMTGNSLLQDNLETLKSQLESSEKSNELAAENEHKYILEIDEMKKENEKLRGAISALETKLEKYLNSNSAAGEKSDDQELQEQEAMHIEGSQHLKNLDEIKEKMKSSDNELVHRSTELSGTAKKIVQLEEHSENDQIMSPLSEENDSENTCSMPSSQCSDLISELNEMNQALRERGEKISRLEDMIREKNRENDTLSNQLKEVQSTMKSREEELATKQEELKKFKSHIPEQEDSSLSIKLQEKIRSLEEEIQQLKKTLQAAENESLSRSSQLLNPNSSGMDAQSEIMSTSTISKAEELHRMKDLEDTFEERYLKLKSVAIKLKKKLAEQGAELKHVEEVKRKLAIEKEELIKKANGNASRNIQVLQGEIDKLQDELDGKLKEMKNQEKQLICSAQELSDFKSKYVAIQEENDQHCNKIRHFEELLSEQDIRNNSLREQVFILEKKLEVEEEKRLKLEENQRMIEGKLQFERQNIDKISKELEETRQECKKHSLIDLEMKDYERTIEDLTSQLNERDTKLSDLERNLKNELNKVENLNEQILLLKSHIESETERAEKLKKTVTDYKNQLSELRSNQEAHIMNKERDRITIEQLNQELEKQKLSMADLSAQSSQIETNLRRTKESAENQVENLEEVIKKYQTQNKELGEELENLKAEFEGYKVRAQSVLRQKARIPEGSFEQLKTEKDQLNSELEAAHIKTHQLQSELAAVKNESGYLSSENERLTQQINVAKTDISKLEISYSEKLAILEKKLESKNAEYQLIIANMSNQSESMNKSFKAQLSRQKENHEQEVKELQLKIEELEEKLWQLKNAANSSVPATGFSKPNGKTDQDKETSSSLSFVPHHIRKTSQGVSANEELKIDVSNMIREDGEGSEWVEPTLHRSPSHPRYSPPTLEQLINTPFPPQQSLDESMSIVSGATEYSGKEVAKLETKISLFEVRIQQLTTLLTESEAENAKLVQLSDALKEEIRRASRNESREKHLENNEYLKNVVLKFLLLKTGDEKFRLVPVLKTILQLSPEEANKLAFIAKGDEVTGATATHGWGEYLHLWSNR